MSLFIVCLFNVLRSGYAENVCLIGRPLPESPRTLTSVSREEMRDGAASFDEPGAVGDTTRYNSTVIATALNQRRIVKLRLFRVHRESHTF